MAALVNFLQQFFSKHLFVAFCFLSKMFSVSVFRKKYEWSKQTWYVDLLKFRSKRNSCLNPYYLIPVPIVFLGKGALKICSKFTVEHPCQSAVSVCTSKFAAYFQSAFSKNTSGGLLTSNRKYLVFTFNHSIFFVNILRKLPAIIASITCKNSKYLIKFTISVLKLLNTRPGFSKERFHGQ